MLQIIILSVFLFKDSLCNQLLQFFLSEPFQFFPLGVRSSIKRRKKFSLCIFLQYIFSLLLLTRSQGCHIIDCTINIFGSKSGFFQSWRVPNQLDFLKSYSFSLDLGYYFIRSQFSSWSRLFKIHFSLVCCRPWKD